MRAALDDMRLVKDAYELQKMRQAAAIASDAHRRAMRAAAPGKMEYEIEALLEAVLWHGGEAQRARDRVRGFTADQRASLVAFLESL